MVIVPLTRPIDEGGDSAISWGDGAERQAPADAAPPPDG
jgi:hypothetical protein